MIQQRFSRRNRFAPEPEVLGHDQLPPQVRAAFLKLVRDFAGDRDDLYPRTGFRSDVYEMMKPYIWSVLDCEPATTPIDAWATYIAKVVTQCEWWEFYDICEEIYKLVLQRYELEGAKEFEDAVNGLFTPEGLAWRLVDGEIQTCSSEAFESSVSSAIETLDETARPTASNELHEALRDLSRRPDADVTGAIQHAMASLECVARDICSDPRATLGQIVSRHPEMLPTPLDDGVGKVWGYASEMARHLREGRVPSREEAELVVGLSAAVVTYLANKHKNIAI